MPELYVPLPSLNNVSGHEILYSKSPYTLFRVTSPEAVRVLSQRSGWKTEKISRARLYLNSGPLFIIYKDSKPYIQFSLDFNRAVLRKEQFLQHYHRLEIKTILEDIGLLDTVAKISFCPNILTHKDLDDIALDAKHSYLYAARVLDSRFYSGEDAIAESAQYSFRYARHFNINPFVAGEPAIAKSAEYSCGYAVGVLEGSFPAGEPLIASSPEFSYVYARRALQKSFPAGEPVIASSAEYSYLYAHNVLKSPFPAGEEAISTDQDMSFLYAKNVLHDPNPELWHQKRKMVKGDYNPWESLS